MKIFGGDNCPRIVLNFTNHRIDHINSLFSIIDRLISNSNMEFNEEEWYILFVSAVLHDIGLQCDFVKHKNVYNNLKNDYCLTYSNELCNGSYDIEEDQKLIRKYHSSITSYWIQDAYINLNNSLNQVIRTIPKNLLAYAMLVCEYHSRMDINKILKC